MTVAIAADAREAGRGWADVRALYDQTVLRAADKLHAHIHSGGRLRATLPSGTVITGLAPVGIGSQRLAPDASRPGLHPVETMRHDAHGPNLDGRDRRCRRPPVDLPCAVRSQSRLRASAPLGSPPGRGEREARYGRSGRRAKSQEIDEASQG